MAFDGPSSRQLGLESMGTPAETAKTDRATNRMLGRYSVPPMNGPFSGALWFKPIYLPKPARFEVFTDSTTYFTFDDRADYLSGASNQSRLVPEASRSAGPTMRS